LAVFLMMRLLLADWGRSGARFVCIWSGRHP